MTGLIICGVDDSESAKGAARVARELGAKLGLRLLFVSVVEANLPGQASAVAARMRQLSESATEVDCGAHWLVEVGHPADRLVAVAEKEAADLVVVGSTGPRSPLLGSISADVSRRAPCPVIVVAPGADQCVMNRNGDGPGTAPGAFLGAHGAGHDLDEPDFAGGIVRFGLGSRAR